MRFIVKGINDDKSFCECCDKNGLQRVESYWTYKAASPTPSYEEAIWFKAIHPNTTESEWNKLSPGMKREIFRAKKLI